MSHSIEERYDVYSESVRVARKSHTCGACKEPITKGLPYMHVSIVSDGTAESLRRCGRCQKLHEHLRGLNPGEQWPAEKLDCGEGYKEHWQTEPPDEIAALAFALPGEVRP